VNISYHTCGTHALQSFLELINLHQEENIILKSIEKEALQMCYVIISFFINSKYNLGQ